MDKKIIAIAIVILIIASALILYMGKSSGFSAYDKQYSPNRYLTINIENFTDNKMYYYLIIYDASNITPSWNGYWFYVLNITQSRTIIKLAKFYTNLNLSTEQISKINNPYVVYPVQDSNYTQIPVFNATDNSFNFEIIATPDIQTYVNNNSLPFPSNYSLDSVILNIYYMSFYIESPYYFTGQNNYSNLFNIINLWIEQNGTAFKILASGKFFYSVNWTYNIQAVSSIQNKYSLIFLDNGYKYSISLYRVINNFLNSTTTTQLIDRFNISNDYKLNLTYGQYEIIAKYNNHTIYYNFTLDSSTEINLNYFANQFNVLYFIIAIIITFLLSIIVFYFTKNIILSMISFNLVFLIFMSMKIMNFNVTWLFLLIFGNIFYVLIKIFGVDKE